MSVINENKVIQVLNRFDEVRALLQEVAKNDHRFDEKFAKICSDVEKFEEDLRDIRKKMNIENLGTKTPATM